MALKFLNLSLRIFLILLIFLTFYIPTHFKLKSLREANAHLKRQISNLKDEIRVLEEKNKKINKNIESEKLAREDLGFIKENEIVIDIKE